MPELPDLTVYVESIRARVAGRRLDRIALLSPFVLRSVDPPLDAIFGSALRDVGLLGKRIVMAFDDERFLVIHLMIAGRLRWRDRGQKVGIGRKMILALLEFEDGTLVLTEASSTKRASMQLVAGRAALAALDPGGIDPLAASFEQFRERLLRERHTVKRTLTDPRLFSGIGNAYSDEILHAARLSPLKLTASLSDDECWRLYRAMQSTLTAWIDRLRQDAHGQVPERVTAFHPAMAVHGRFKQPCAVCGHPVQRIVYAANECNYCPTCQTGGRLLADRSLSRLLKHDWPKTIDET